MVAGKCESRGLSAADFLKAARQQFAPEAAAVIGGAHIWKTSKIFAVIKSTRFAFVAYEHAPVPKI
jgi:hypothetical protein